jgi:hypothetical protein
MADGTFLWDEWNMNNVLGKYDDGIFLCTFDTANFKIIFNWTKGIR